jgi:hypothetical protein
MGGLGVSRPCFVGPLLSGLLWPLTSCGPTASRRQQSATLHNQSSHPPISPPLRYYSAFTEQLLAKLRAGTDAAHAAEAADAAVAGAPAAAGAPPAAAGAAGAAALAMQPHGGPAAVAHPSHPAVAQVRGARVEGGCRGGRAPCASHVAVRLACGFFAMHLCTCRSATTFIHATQPHALTPCLHPMPSPHPTPASTHPTPCHPTTRPLPMPPPTAPHCAQAGLGGLQRAHSTLSPPNPTPPPHAPIPRARRRSWTGCGASSPPKCARVWPPSCRRRGRAWRASWGRSWGRCRPGCRCSCSRCTRGCRWERRPVVCNLGPCVGSQPELPGKMCASWPWPFFNL